MSVVKASIANWLCVSIDLSARFSGEGEKMWLFWSGNELHNWCKILFEFKNVNCFSQFDILAHTRALVGFNIRFSSIYHWKRTFHISHFNFKFQLNDLFLLEYNQIKWCFHIWAAPIQFQIWLNEVFPSKNHLKIR